MAHTVQPPPTGRISNNRAVDLPAPGLQPPPTPQMSFKSTRFRKAEHRGATINVQYVENNVFFFFFFLNLNRINTLHYTKYTK